MTQIAPGALHLRVTRQRWIQFRNVPLHPSIALTAIGKIPPRDVLA